MTGDMRESDNRTPKKEINIPLRRGTIGIFFSIIQTIPKDIIVVIIKGGIAIFKFLSLL